MLCFLNRFSPNAAAAYVGAPNEFAASPTKRLLPPPPPLPQTAASTTSSTSATSAVMGYHQSSLPSTAVGRWTEFGKSAAAPLVDCSVASYFNNNLLWYLLSLLSSSIRRYRTFLTVLTETNVWCNYTLYTTTRRVNIITYL